MHRIEFIYKVNWLNTSSISLIASKGIKLKLLKQIFPAVIKDGPSLVFAGRNVSAPLVNSVLNHHVLPRFVKQQVGNTYETEGRGRGSVKLLIKKPTKSVGVERRLSGWSGFPAQELTFLGGESTFRHHTRSAKTCSFPLHSRLPARQGQASSRSSGWRFLYLVVVGGHENRQCRKLLYSLWLINLHVARLWMFFPCFCVGDSKAENFLWSFFLGI